MIRITAKYALMTAVGLVLFSALRVLVMNDVLDFDLAVTVTAALFVASGIALGIWFGRGYPQQAVKSKSENIVAHLPLQALLSKRELEVFELLLHNKTNQQICDLLFIEMSTLKTHINRIYKKLDVTNRRQLFAKHAFAANQTVESASRLQINSQA